eukprot:m.206242 g.206242  ORF g.206242 m.206242 type:complete len:283 (-) comp15795_c0_seq4:3155-4003(-)
MMLRRLTQCTVIPHIAFRSPDATNMFSGKARFFWLCTTCAKHVRIIPTAMYSPIRTMSSKADKQKPKLDKEEARKEILQTRNIGIMAHIDAGKTTVTERMLYYSGITNSIGSVDDGTTQMDYLDEERARGITIISAATSFLWNKHKINLIDTPGHVDFTVEVERALRVLDGGVLVIDGVAGVQAQTRTVWKQARKFEVPSIGFINKMDRDGANFSSAIESLHKELHITPLPLQSPIFLKSSEAFVGVSIIYIELEYVHQHRTTGSRFSLHENVSVGRSNRRF